MTIQGHNDHIWAYVSHEYHIQVRMLQFPFVYLFHSVVFLLVHDIHEIFLLVYDIHEIYIY